MFPSVMGEIRLLCLHPALFSSHRDLPLLADQNRIFPADSFNLHLSELFHIV